MGLFTMLYHPCCLFCTLTLCTTSVCLSRLFNFSRCHTLTGDQTFFHILPLPLESSSSISQKLHLSQTMMMHPCFHFTSQEQALLKWYKKYANISNAELYIQNKLWWKGNYCTLELQFQADGQITHLFFFRLLYPQHIVCWERGSLLIHKSHKNNNHKFRNSLCCILSQSQQDFLLVLAKTPPNHY